MRRYGILALFALALAAPAGAQGTAGTDTIPRRGIGEADLPRDVAERITAFFNDPETIHFTGRTRIPPERTITGDVAVLGGPLVVAGRIDGDVVVINGDVELLSGASVTGDLTVVGGAVTGQDDARLGGEVVAYSGRLPYERRGERIVWVGRARDAGDDDSARTADDGDGRSDFIVATGQSYNRVEGLPITFGPVIETAGRNPLRLRAAAVFRTEDGTIDPGRWGYDVRLEQFLGGYRAFRVGAAYRSVVDPIEGWHLSKLENGLSTFFLHQDFRDHYLREGWSGYATLAPEGSPLSLTAEFRSEKHVSVPSGSPWTLFDNSEPWRAQPLVGEGRLNSAIVHGELDTRSHAAAPSTGWYVQASVERALESDLRRPEYLSHDPLLPGATLQPERAYGEFTAGTVDVRRYNRISPTALLNLRVVAGGSLDGTPLPPQRQHALGGEGTLPGYRLFSRDCGARGRHVTRPRDVQDVPGEGNAPGAPRFFTSYGCDRFALVQTEYRGRFNFRFDWDEDGAEGKDEDDGWDVDGRWDADFGWVFFMDAGRGWSQAGGRDEETAVDLGAGVLLGRVGIYGAIPLRGPGGVNLFVRLTPRF